MSFDATIRAEVQAFSTKQGVEASLVDAKRQEGVFDGQRVKVADQGSAVANAAEEMSFAASEKVEKKLSERKSGSKEALKSSATELAEKYVNMMGESQGGKRLHEFLDALKNKSGGMSEAELRQFVGEEFGDESDQFAALSFAEEALAKEGGHEELRTKIASVKAQLLADAGPAIRAGLNIAADIVAFSREGLEGAQGLRDLYRFSILGGQSITSIYNGIMERYGPAQFTQSLEFLLRASGSDLEGKALGSSLEPAQLKSAIDDIYHVQALGNTFKSLGEVLTKTRTLFAL
jgi:type III secretion protein W